jgi:TonB-dependent starch-binding outer membrane protein SusC
MRLMRAGLVAVLLAGLSAPATLAAQQSTGTIRGQVTDAATGRPISGTQVYIPGTGHGTITNAQGAFLLTNVPAGTVTLRAEMLGYAPITQEVTVTAGQTAAANFNLSQTAVALDELVVTATGQKRKKEIGNSMATIDVADMKSTPVKGAQEMLNGDVAGVYVMANSGQPGAGGTIRLRGNNSVSQGNNPIIYVDGVRIYSGLTPTMPLNRNASLPLNDINPDDIARIEIIKGPAATTLYGTEASAGVIQIFTKQGQSGAPRWNAEIGAGFNHQGHIGSSVDPTGMWINDCSGIQTAGDGTTFQDPSCPSSGSWLRNGPIQRYSVSVRGGQPQLSYYVSGSYSNENGTLKNTSTAAGGFRANFSFRPTSTLNLKVNTSYTRRNTDWVPDGNSANGVLLNVSRGPGGNFKGGTGCDPSVDACLNNGEIFTTTNTTKSDHYITGVTLEYSPRNWLMNRLSVGYDYNNTNDQNVLPFGYYRVPLGELWWQTWAQKLITIDWASTVSNTFGEDLTSAFSVGAQMFDSRNETVDVNAADFSGPGEPTMMVAALRSITGDDRLRVVNAGFFFQEVVGWKDRAFLTAGLRVDGNSAFGQNFGLQPYPKISASYVLSDHSFWPKDLIQTFKLRAAVGESGKAPGAFDAVRTWDPIAGSIISGDPQPGFTPAQLGNEDLGPERTREYEGGFEMSALDGRVGADVSYYYQRTFDALIPVTYPPSQGFLSNQLENIGKLRTLGWEVKLDGTFVRTDNLEWHARMNYSTIDSKALDIGGQTYTVNSLARSYVVEGLPVPAYYGKKVMNPNAYADPIIEEDQFLGSPYPTKIISLSSDVTLFGRLTATALGEWQLGGHLLNAVGYQNSRKFTYAPCYAAQEKMRSGDLSQVTALERVKCSWTTGVRDYDWWVESTDFFKLRSASLSYQLPDRWIPGGKSASLTLEGRNLLTVTNYSGTDPETTDTRGNLFSRRDYYVFPQSRTFLLSLRVSF